MGHAAERERCTGGRVPVCFVVYNAAIASSADIAARINIRKAPASRS